MNFVCINLKYHCVQFQTIEMTRYIYIYIVSRGIELNCYLLFVKCHVCNDAKAYLECSFVPFCVWKKANM